jgi:hypothetical protein
MVATGGRFARVVVGSDGETLGMPRSKASAGAALIEVVLRNGRVLRVPDGVAPSRVAALADVLEGLQR